MINLAVGLNALFLHYPRTGTGRYVRHLVEGMRDRVNLSLIGANAFPAADPTTGFSSRKVFTPFDRGSRQLAKIWFEQAGFGFAARRLDLDLAHVPYFGSGIVSALPTVVTVHDLVPIVRPEYRRTRAEALYTSLVTLGLRSASAIVTDSVASARDLQTHLRVRPKKVSVIPLGVDERFRPMTSADDRAWATDVRSNLGVSVPYLLYVGGFDRRKNVDRLLEAFGRLKRERQIQHSLYLVGTVRSGQSFFYDPRPDIERLALGNSIGLLGQRSDDEIQALLTGADAFVFPSLYEGFGLPPLEAMASGTPVVCSNTSSLPEVVGDAGVLFDPLFVEEIMSSIARVVGDSELRLELARRGLERASIFTWKATMEATFQVYALVAKKTP
jgi:glycosyltransferase involved in cell wall biosynthesis